MNVLGYDFTNEDFGARLVPCPFILTERSAILYALLVL